MNEIKIEKGVPMPISGANGLTATIRKLDVGDSFAINLNSQSVAKFAASSNQTAPTAFGASLNPIFMTLTKQQLEILKHTRDRAAGGYYCGDSPDMQILVTAGLMVSAGFKSFVPDEYFKRREVLNNPIVSNKQYDTSKNAAIFVAHYLRFNEQRGIAEAIILQRAGQTDASKSLLLQADDFQQIASHLAYDLGTSPKRKGKAK